MYASFFTEFAQQVCPQIARRFLGAGVAVALGRERLRWLTNNKLTIVALRFYLFDLIRSATRSALAAPNGC